MFCLFLFCKLFVEGGRVVLFILSGFAIISPIEVELFVLSFWFCNHFAEGGRVVLSSVVLQSFRRRRKRFFVLSGFAILSLKDEELFVLYFLVLQSFR